VVIAPLGVVLPDAMMGEITAGIAAAVLGSRADKYLIPTAQRHFVLVGSEPAPVGALIAQAVDLVKRRLQG
jgi:hypothetical protein